MSAWEFEKAIVEFTSEYENNKGDLSPLGGRANAYLSLGNSRKALEDFEYILSNQDPRLYSSGEYIKRGICLWYLGDPKRAVYSWRQSITAPYQDAAGGVIPPSILLYASARLKNKDLEKESIQLLNKHLTKFKKRIERGEAKTPRQLHDDRVHPGLYAWPGAIVPFLLNEINSQELDKVAFEFHEHPTLKDRCSCQADFYVGLQANRIGDNNTFSERMQKCASHINGILEDEWYLARWEVNKSFPDNPFPHIIYEYW